MSQLLVRKVDERTVQKLKARAQAHGVSTEEEHRRILYETLNQSDHAKPTLIQFLSHTEVAEELDLDLERSRDIEERETGF